MNVEKHRLDLDLVVQKILADTLPTRQEYLEKPAPVRQ